MSLFLDPPHKLTPEQRRQIIAAILARALHRLLKGAPINDAEES